MIGHFRKAGIRPKRIVKEFEVSPDAHVPVGAKFDDYYCVSRPKVLARNNFFCHPFRAWPACRCFGHVVCTFAYET
jgi:hypothetical protein